MALRLDQWVQGDVLEILSTIHNIELLVAGVRGGAVAPSVKGVGGVDGDIIRVLANVTKDAGEDALEPIGQRSAVDIQEELVEQTRRGTHDETAIVKTTDAGLVVGQTSAHETRAQVLGGDETKDSRVKGTKLPGVNFEHGCVTADEQLAGVTTISHQDGQRHVTLLEVIGQGDGRPSLARASFGVVDKLVRQSTAPTLR